LGASVTGISTMLSKDFIKLVGIAVLLAAPIAWWAMNNWFNDFSYLTPCADSKGWAFNLRRSLFRIWFDFCNFRV